MPKGDTSSIAGPYDARTFGATLVGFRERVESVRHHHRPRVMSRFHGRFVVNDANPLRELGAEHLILCARKREVEGAHRDAMAFVGLRKLLRQPRGDHGQLGLRARASLARLQHAQ